jgi:hypothetical protein
VAKLGDAHLRDPFVFPAGKSPVSVTLPKNRDSRIFALANG